MSKVVLKQVKSVIDRSKKQKDTMVALGLKGIGKTAEHNLTPQIRGMINKVSHLITIEEK